MATAVKRPTGREEVVDAILDAAERLFAASGPADISLRSVAREAGVNYGLVHRHFGTKDELLERLLERYAERWTAQLDAVPDYRTALDTLFGGDVDTGAYLRVLAWMLVSDRTKDAVEAPRRHARLDLLVDLDHAPSTRATTAAALALAFGWRLFNPFIRDALHVDAASTPEFHEAVRRRLHALIKGEAGEAPGERG